MNNNLTKFTMSLTEESKRMIFNNARLIYGKGNQASNYIQMLAEQDDKRLKKQSK